MQRSAIMWHIEPKQEPDHFWQCPIHLCATKTAPIPGNEWKIILTRLSQPSPKEIQCCSRTIWNTGIVLGSFKGLQSESLYVLLLLIYNSGTHRIIFYLISLLNPLTQKQACRWPVTAFISRKTQWFHITQSNMGHVTLYNNSSTENRH